MKATLFLLAILAVSVSGFAPNPSFSISKPVSTKLFAEQDPADVPEVKNLVRNVDNEPQWKDNAMKANTSTQVSPWAGIFILFPVVLFLDDVFHFLPSK